MAPESSALKKGARVVVIDDLPGVVAGTAGRVGRSIGIKTVRYRVQFENGVNSMSVAESKLVSPAAWEFIKERQVASPEIAATTPPPAPVTAAPQPSPKAPSEPSSSSAPSDAMDARLAALTAKSRDARKAAGVDVDAEATEDPPIPEVAEPEADDPVSKTSEVADDSPTPEAAEPVADEPVSEASEVPKPAEPVFNLPDGYFPPDNRIADLLASVKGS